MTAFYNEIDPFAAAWLRQLIEYGHIAPGIVDERSIEDIRPDELTDFTQVHWFAGIGCWSHALRSAGWSDDRPIWTASCPCQPFSAAGKGGGFDDERHLWPALYWHISQCRPEVIIGEQVASKDGLAWWQLVSSDLEIAGYANAAVDFCAASVGAPHIRQRLYWVGMADADSEASSGWRIQRPGQSDGAGVGSTRERPAGLRTDDGVADANGSNAGTERQQRSGQFGQQPQDSGPGQVGHDRRTSPTNGFWRDADWLFCRDGKWRPVEPSSQQMVDGSSTGVGRLRDNGASADADQEPQAQIVRHFPLAKNQVARTGRLRGYGNAIVAPQAAVFIEAVMDSIQTVKA